MKKKSFMIVLLAFLLVIPIAVSAGPIQLTVAEIHPKDYPTTQGLFQFAELVKQRSGGKISGLSPKFLEELNSKRQ